jgi:predicted phosphodiesterase
LAEDCAQTSLKTLIFSDVHYPAGISKTCFQIIRKEKPDIVALLGDIVVGRGPRLLGNMRSFFERYPHPLDRSVVVLGDNEFKGDRRALEFVSKLSKLNPDPFTHRFGNMFFAHGNVEGRGRFSGLLEEAGGLAARLLKPLTPRLVSSVARLEYRLGSEFYLFMGHIHYLGYVKPTHTAFCGTLSTKKMVYGLNESLGYVVVDHSKSGFMREDGIRLIRIGSGLDELVGRHGRI